ncbi:MAG: hypothetical protein MJ214_03460 [Bacilli bacterium]|nr:hypothetical protein [Bacilli bacterium]
MQTNKQQTASFPYLSINTKDYKDFSFELSISKQQSNDNIAFNVAYTLKNDDINKLIENKKVSVVIELSCKSLGYNKYSKLDFDSKNATLIIDKMDIDKTVDIIAYLVVNESFYYSNSELSDYWNDEKYYVEKGNIIGESLSYTINIFHKKAGKKSSIFHFVERDTDPLDPIEYKLERDNIDFVMPKTVFRLYDNIQDRKHEIILSTFIIPCLTDILRQMQNDPELDFENDFNSRYKDKRWYQVITERYEKLFGENPTVSRNDPYRAAQMLVSKPIYETLRFSKKSLDMKEEND